MSDDVVETVVKWFSNNMELFGSGMTKADQDRFWWGDNILGYPDGDGIYAKDATGKDNVTDLYYYYSSGKGWLWSPDKYKDNWMTTRTLTVRNRSYKGEKPDIGNQKFILKLRKIEDQYPLK